MQEILRTVPRRGYILVEQGAPARTDGGEGIAQHDAAERLAEPVVAILPFVVDAVDGEGRIPLQSFNEELIDAISRFRSVAVIAPASVRRFAFDDDIARAGVALKADYCVSGSIANGKEIAVRVDLVEVSSAVVYGPIPSLPPSHISWRPQRCWQPESSDVWSGRSKPMRRAGRRGRPPRACKPMPT
jgi:TolB-like protein